MNYTRKKVLSNLIWRFLERVGAQLVSVVVSLVLARILNPSDYGTVAMITVFISILNVVIDAGLTNALIQKKNADDLDFSTVFIFNITLCTVMYVSLYVLAPSIAQFYNNEAIVGLVRLAGITIIISGAKNVMHAYVSRNLLFKRFFFSTLSGTIISAIVGIVMACNGFGAYALVTQIITNNLVDTAILWNTVGWKPQWIFSFQRLKNLFSYSWKLFVTVLYDTFVNQFTQMIIGKVYTASDLAFYNQGQMFPQMIVGNVDDSINSVLFPVLSSSQDSKEEIKRMMKRSLTTSVYVIAPMVIGMAVVAPNTIKVFLTEKWLESTFYLRIFCVVYLIWPIHTINLNAIKAVGRSDLFLYQGLLKITFGLFVTLLTMKYGVRAMAYGMIVGAFFSKIVNVWPNKKLINYGYFEQMRDTVPIIIHALLMVVPVNYIGRVITNPIICLIVQVICGALIYIIGSELFQIEPYIYLKECIINMKGKKK